MEWPPWRYSPPMAMVKKSSEGRRTRCARCGFSRRNKRGDCVECVRIQTSLRRQRRASEKPECSVCGRVDWTPKGACRVCIRASLDRRAGKPCRKCGEPLGRSGCSACKRRCERVRNGLAEASNASGVGENCGICKVVLTDKKGQHPYALDHDHVVGFVRGWLCIRCNTGLGNFRDSSVLLRAAADYLDRHNRQ